MRRSLFFIPPFFIMSLVYAQPSVDITFVANDGFLITNDTHKVLIDAIFSEGSGMFTTPTETVLAQERNASEPFNSIDFLLNTHYHADHINAGDVAEHMVNDTGSVWIGPGQSYDLLAADEHFSTIENRVFSLLPDSAVKLDTLINGFRFHVVRLIHYNNPENTIQNLGYVFTLGDICLFHPGDGFLNDTAEIENLDLAADSIDILFLSYRVLDNDFENLGRNIISYLKPKVIILMHIPLNQAEHYNNLAAGLENLPSVFVMEEQMGKLTFIESGDSLVVENNTATTALPETPVRVFPNPTNNNITVQLNNIASLTAHLEVIDLFGNRLTEMILPPDESNISFCLEAFPSGLYILKIAAGRTSFCGIICRE